MPPRSMIDDFLGEFRLYKQNAEKAIAQVDDAALARVLAPDTNSITVLVRHLAGNLRSRFTQFLSTDGEKPWRARDREFEPWSGTRAELLADWDAAWFTVFAEVGALEDADLSRTVVIRGKSLTVHAALARSVAHVATHVGQIVLLARVLATEDWTSLSIPRGGSSSYNQDPALEQRPR
ncbi:MAG: DUF1572 family protein [Planctomycetes bacterium]|nr:DUF1572 family protein [Planctomycetota bacterium]